MTDKLKEEEFSLDDHAQEMVVYHTKQLQVCMEIYHKCSKQVKMHELMLNYYQTQLKNERSK